MEDLRPLISVVVPVYQAEDTLSECVNSILSQTFQDFELILVDDGSRDGSLDKCKNLAVSDSRIHVIHQENMGPNPARATGTAHARGLWLAFVDSDDTLPPSALASLYAATDEDTDIVLGNGYSLPNECRTTIPISDFRHLAVRGEGTIGLPWGSLYRLSLVTPSTFSVPKDFRMGEDYIFWLRLVFRTEKPVRIVYEQVYEKGNAHISSKFHWTASYAHRIHELRIAAIPVDQRHEYLFDTVIDRIDNLFSVAIANPKKEWIHSNFYREIQTDLHRLNRHLPLKQWLFLHVQSRSFRKLYSLISNLRAWMRQHLSAKL